MLSMAFKWSVCTGAGSADISNQEKYRHVSVPVRASFLSQEQVEQSRAQNDDEVNKAKVDSRQMKFT